MVNPGHCYEETFDIMLRDDTIARNGKIVHGIVQDPDTKKWIDHAWIECFNNMVIDPTISDNMMRKNRYYEITHAKPEHFYSDLEAVNQVFKQNKGFCKWNDRKSKKSSKPKRKVCKCKK